MMKVGGFFVFAIAIILVAACTNPSSPVVAAQKPVEIPTADHPRPRIAQTVNVLNGRSALAYYQGDEFRGSDEEIRRRFIFNNINKIPPSDLQQDPLFSGKGLNSSDVQLEEEVFLTVKPSVPELQNGISNVLSKLQEVSSFDELEVKGPGRSIRPYQTTISYQASFQGPILNLKTIIRSENTTDPNLYTAETEERNDLRFSILTIDKRTGSYILSMLPSAGYGDGANPYTLPNSIEAHEGSNKVYPGYLRTTLYCVKTKEAGAILDSRKVEFTYNDRKLNGLDAITQNMWPTGSRFLVPEKYSILLEYLALLYNELHRQIKVDVD